jgi:ketosteroid isomerase-like protein
VRTEDEVLDLIAKDHIRDRIIGYCRGVDRCDAALIRATYHDDAIEDHGDKYRGGPDGFVDWVIGHISRMSGSMHALHQINIELDGDAARVESYATARHVLSGENEAELLETLGVRYVDRFENRSGAGWRVARRVVALEYYDVRELPLRDQWRSGFATPQQSSMDPSYAF